MTEKDYAPLSTACVKSLNDKFYEKRKAAALEIDKMVKDFAAHNNTAQIKRLFKVLGQDFATSHNPHGRKGGLIGLGAMAVGLGSANTAKYMEEFIPPILVCFNDSDLRVRYCACESLYNVVKVARGAILPYFTDIFGALSKSMCDSDQSVKNATELLDRLMKDIVTESDDFDLLAFISVLRERMYTKNPFGRQFIISWILVLISVPDIDMVIYLTDILDGLFKILEDPIPEIKRSAETVFMEFLHSIKLDPSRVDFAGMINILILHAQSSDELLQLTAITWMDEFIRLSGQNLLPYTSGIFIAILTCLSYDGDTRKIIKETATHVNDSLYKLIISNSKEPSITDSLDLSSIIEVLTKHLMLQQIPVQTKVTVLKWICHLLMNLPDKMYLHNEELFPVLMKVLSDNSEEVVQQTLVVMSELINLKSTNIEENKYFTKFMVNLLRLFATDRHLLEDRGAFIIRELCVLLNPEHIFKVLAEILREEQNLRFAAIMAQSLHTILLTSSELFELRNKLKDLKTEESVQVFIQLYKSWCHNPVATMSLCLLTQNYGHACDLVKYFGNIEVTVEFLTEVDKLIQLIESPIFTYLRLELLEKNESLVCALYGLLMILPQSEAFFMLHRRLSAVPVNSNRETKTPQTKSESIRDTIDFQELFQYFIDTQEKHKEQKHKQRQTLLANTKEVANLVL
ncbi:PREDICTED: protein VAC14 homolog [Ceratosolen solmsi marchali]|uniref:Protein VAC14 homolog n=1 Tax=Ceratosolen solmsi marchali TaxID=326594 RepID=A0AAJ6YBL0_9HYME|nr:PREDICTED: protein VAC14 homolog [Ceratosolen solmsi marchali]